MVDDLDTKIINSLVLNSKVSSRELARKVGVSVVTVLKRIKDLEKEGLIKFYTVNLNYEKLGYDVHVIVKMRIAKGKLFEVEGKIAVDPHVFAVYDVTGDFDAIVIAKFKNRKMMDLFLKKIQTYDFVERTETSLILNTIKEQPIVIE
ncbi:putative HTH-type transcriptional regulator [uncultured archaeon]|nr:putative HTH-type transcriptional regulator [uncultured archaeon]